ncbi:hypothetical protein CVT25_000676 [Psilocybe cyanescens]|uniref:ATPase inhibitor, mitochondrial n=1 Tax=Psilocybe cyanescens TaxID=93625 RepID=A0A409WZP4_PSICY|nr:hypothetical protein CVT25_000676 [Psilocybe cyanescens]
MLSAARRLPRAVGVSARLYTTGRTEGSVAQSKGFNKKEKAHEDQFVHAHEMEQLAKLRAQIEAKKDELSELQKDADAITNKATPKA